MDRIYTNTTDFKRALKTITDIMTVAELRENDLVIQFEYSLGIAKLLAKHPVDDIIVETEYPIQDSTSEEVRFSIELGQLSEALKKYRRKEDFVVAFNGQEVIFETEDDVVYDCEAIDVSLELMSTKETSGIKVSRKDLVESFHIGRTVTRATFHDSTSLIKLIYTGKDLHLYSTNFAQVIITTLDVEADDKKPIDVNLESGLLTKVRNTIHRGKGKSAHLNYHNSWITIKTENNTVQFKSSKDEGYINFQDILKNTSWQEETYVFDKNQNEDVLTDIYDKFKLAEDNKESADEEKYSKVYFESAGGELLLSKEGNNYLFTRDLNSIYNRLPDTMDVAKSEKALLFRKNYENRRLMILTAYGTLNE